MDKTQNKNIVAVTPFILNYQQEPFYEFSWKNKDGSYFPVYGDIQSLQKVKGQPIQKITGEIVFNFLNPLMLKDREQRGFSIVRNTGQAIWTQSESNVINESNTEVNKSYDVKISNTKFKQIEPFTNGLVIFTVNSKDVSNISDLKLGFYVRGERIGNVFNGKIVILP